MPVYFLHQSGISYYSDSTSTNGVHELATNETTTGPTSTMRPSDMIEISVSTADHTALPDRTLCSGDFVTRQAEFERVVRDPPKERPVRDWHQRGRGRPRKGM